MLALAMKRAHRFLLGYLEHLPVFLAAVIALVFIGGP